MPITSVFVEPNGWVLNVTLVGDAGGFENYVLDPDGQPRVIVSSYHAGHTRRTVDVVRNTQLRTLICTKPLRRPVDPAAPTFKLIDERSNADGTRTVRLALSEHIYVTDAGIGVRFAIGWRSGENATGTIAAANRSKVVAPIPIFRWADVPYQIQSGSFALEVFGASHHPIGTQAVAGVRFSITDGNSVDYLWAVEQSTSLLYGDRLRCYRVVVDASRAAGFRAGLLRCDAEIFPWIGAVRTTGSNLPRAIGGSGGGGFQTAMQPVDGLSTASFQTKAEAPFVVAWNPGNQRYAPAFVYVDPYAGSPDPAAVIVSGNAAYAATAPARDLTTACQAVNLANRSAMAANGQPAQTHMADGVVIRLRAGVHAGPGETLVTSELSAAESWLVVEGDPADANPRANVILQTADGYPGLRAPRLQMRNLTLELGTANLDYGLVRFWWYNNVELRGRAGQDQNAKPASGTGFAVFYTQCRYWKHGFSMRWSYSHQPFLIRGCEGSRRMEAITILTTKWIAALDATVSDIPNSSNELYATGGWPGVPDRGSQEDVIIALNDLRSTRDRTWLPANLSADLAGTTLPSCRRQVFLNNVVERVVPSGGDTNFSIGEDQQVEASYNIIEGNSIVGERLNLLYDTPRPTTLAECDTLNNLAYCNRFANNATDKVATKHDDYDDPVVRYFRSTSGNANQTGYRPQATGAWPALYGVGFENNIDFGRLLAGSFEFEYFGRGSVQGRNGQPAYLDDRSRLGSGTGQGNYQPSWGSPLVARATRGNLDRDLRGATRGTRFAVGCLEAMI